MKQNFFKNEVKLGSLSYLHEDKNRDLKAFVSELV
jgi:hypothetical protein